jgi:antirestriction protein ArdC
MKKDVYKIITDRILEALEAGTCPWRKSWVGVGMPRSMSTGKPYRGVNIFILGFQPYSSAYWLTFNQCKKMGGMVKKGEKGTPVVFWKFLRKTQDDGTVKQIPFLRYYTVFNVEQCEGIDAPDAPERTHTPLEAAEAIIGGMPKRPEINHGGDRAAYCPSLDTIRLPKPEQFETAEAYYTTAFHELAHSTGHDSRLSRDLVAFSMDKGSYSREELIAEMTAAFLSGEAGIDDTTLDNSAAYIASWRKALSDDPKLIIQAAGKAQKAADYILDRKPEKVGDDE